MNDLEELRNKFQCKEEEHAIYSLIIDKIKDIIEDDDIDAERITLYIEGLIQDNTKLLEENQSLNERIEEIVANQAMNTEMVNE